MGRGTILGMRYRKNAQLLASDAAELLREQGIPVVPQAIDVGDDIDAEVIRLGDSVEIAELPEGTFMVSVWRGGEWDLESVEYSLGDAVSVASVCYSGEHVANAKRPLGEWKRTAKVIVSKGPPWSAKVYDSSGHIRSAVTGHAVRGLTDKQYVEEWIRDFFPDAQVEYVGMNPNSRNPDDYAASPQARLADLHRQGFMKPRRAKKASVPERPIVACDDCLDWHREGKHTADAATRKRNRAERMARLKR